MGEDGLSAQSSYTIDINDSNYIDNLAPHPTMFDNKVPLGEDTFKKVYTQLISALNDKRIQKNTNLTLSAIWNGKSLLEECARANPDTRICPLILCQCRSGLPGRIGWE